MECPAPNFFARNYMKHSIKSVIAAFAFVFSAAFAAAQHATIDSVCQTLANHPVTTGNYVQEKTSANSSRVLRSNGTFILSRKALGLRNIKPVKSFRGLTPDYMIRVTPDGAKTVIEAAGNETFRTIAELVDSLFDGEKTLLEKNFTVQFSADDSGWNMKLYPKDKTIASVLNVIDIYGTGSGNNCVLNTLKIADEKGGTMLYKLSDLVYKEDLSGDEKALFAKK